jgi:hypothetical protein
VNIVFPLEKSKTCLITKVIRYRKYNGSGLHYGDMGDGEEWSLDPTPFK